MKKTLDNPINHLVLKDESNGSGPLYVVYEDGTDSNYKDSTQKHTWDDKYFALWFSRHEAEKIAKSLNVPLELY